MSVTSHQTLAIQRAACGKRRWQGRAPAPGPHRGTARPTDTVAASHRRGEQRREYPGNARQTGRKRARVRWDGRSRGSGKSVAKGGGGGGDDARRARRRWGTGLSANDPPVSAAGDGPDSVRWAAPLPPPPACDTSPGRRGGGARRSTAGGGRGSRGPRRAHDLLSDGAPRENPSCSRVPSTPEGRQQRGPHGSAGEPPQWRFAREREERCAEEGGGAGGVRGSLACDGEAALGPRWPRRRFAGQSRAAVSDIDATTRSSFLFARAWRRWE